MDLESLVSIDVDAEIRKVAGAELHGPWQWPTEWVRRAFGAGATRVSVSTVRSRLRIVDDGARIGREHLERLARLLDEKAAPEARHEALTALEGAEQKALVALAGIGLSEIALQVGAADEEDARGWRFRWRRGQVAAVEAAAARVPETQIELRLDELGGRQALTSLAQAARFASRFGKQVEVNAKPVAAAALPRLHETVEAPCRAVLALPRNENSGQLWLIVHGIVADHVALARPPHFDAAIEIGAAKAGNPAALRAEAAALVPALTPRFVEVLATHARRIERMAEDVRARLSRALLQAAGNAGLRASMRGVCFLRAVLSPDPTATAQQSGASEASEPDCFPVPQKTTIWLSLDDLDSLAHPAGAGAPGDGAAGSAIAALDAREDPERFALDKRPTLILDEQERALLVEVGFRLQAPARLEARLSFAALGAQVALAAKGLADRLRWPRARPLPENQLSPDERALLESLRPLVDAQKRQVGFCEGAGTVRFVRDRLHLLPRDNTAVRAAVAAVKRDPAWLYPAALALFEANAPPLRALAAARERWRQRLLRPAPP